VIIAREVGDKRNEALILNYRMLASTQLGRSKLAILFGKEAVNALQRIRSSNRNLTQESRRSFLDTNA
jgi:hypothetical protein